MRSTYEFTLTPDQYIRSLKHGTQRFVGHMPWGWLVKALGIATFVIAGFLVALSFDYLGGRHAMIARPMFYASLALFAVILLYPVVYYRGQRRLMSEPNFMVGTPRKIEIDETGLRSVHDHCDARYDWGGIETIERAGDIVILYLDKVFYVPIPVSAFADDAECQAFIDFARARMEARRQAAQEAAPAISPFDSDLTPAADTDLTPAVDSAVDSVIPPIEAPQRAKSLARLSLLLANARNALRLAFFLPVPEERFPVSWWQIVAFASVSLAVPVVIAVTMSGFSGELNWQSMPEAMLHLGVALLSAIAAGYLFGHAARIPRLLLASVMVVTVVDAIVFLSWVAVSLAKIRLGSIAYEVYQFGPPLWWAMAFAAFAARQTHVSRLRQFASGMALAVLMILPLAGSDRDRSFWTPQRDKAAGERKPRISPASEDVLNAQPDLLARQLAAVETGRKNTADVFFIGMAGYGHQDVFRKEVDAVETLFRERFGTAGRSVKLINNGGTVLAAPFASKTNLRAALQRVAQQMDKDEDVLVLFLTSHGSETHQFSLDLWPLQFNKLDPMGLRGLLDESGIRNRVVIVSACYSGGFVNALRDDNTLVISASAPDRNSFGCSNEAEWTYFGKAYFDEALRGTYSFTEAFEKALPIISEREKKDDYKPSQPQMAIGAGIAPRLEALTASLREAGALRSPSPSPPPSSR